MYKPTHNSSLIQERTDEKVNFATQLFGNTKFRIGIILEAFDVEDEKNISKLGPEYTVMAIEQDGQNGQNTSIYKNCITMDGFGAAADFFQFTRRKAKKPKEVKKKGSLKDEVASIVGLLCLDGNSEKAVIIGSFGNPSRQVTLDKEKGHHLEGEFNGVNWKVDKDGALTVTFNSATDDEGKPQDEEAGGTVWKIEKDGSFEFTDGATENIRVDKTAKTVDINAEKDISATTKANVNVTADESMNITTKKDLIAMCEGKANFDVKKSFEIKAKSKFSVEAQQIMAKSKSMIQFQAQSMFQVQAASSIIMNAPQVLLGSAPAQPALLAYDLITLGVGNLGAPVISNAIAGYSTQIIISA